MDYQKALMSVYKYVFNSYIHWKDKRNIVLRNIYET